MKFPNFTDLDKEQIRIYGHAPTDGAILVVGAPGTGKTIMAFHRAQKLVGIGQKPCVIMFNRVLRKYSGARRGVAEKVPVMTMNEWVHRWWQGARMGSAPKDQNNSWTYDWPRILGRIEALTAGDERLKALNWGHLIIDEGQDFSEDMYFSLGRILRHFTRNGVDAQITVFADDNQRLEAEKNSTVDNIARNLGIRGSNDRVFVLQKNYRNSKQIARFARYFQVGRTSGAAKPPDRSGALPIIGLFATENELYDFVIRRAKQAIGKQIGIIVHGSQFNVKSTFAKLESALPAPFKVQRYYYAKKLKLDESLDFESPNVVTVVNEKSAKGLEFDLVFYLGLERVNIDDSGGLTERMVVYVMSSRARDELLVLFAGVANGSRVPDGLTLMPRGDLKLCSYDGYGDMRKSSTDLVKTIKWREPDPEAPFWTETL